MPFLPSAKLYPPIPAGFDYDSLCAVPDSLHNLLIPISHRHRLNVAAETHNEASIAATRLCQMDAGTNLTLDVGEPLKPYFAYSPEELEEMVNSEEGIKQSGPIPYFVRREVDSERTRIRDEEKEAKELRKKMEKEGIPIDNSWAPSSAIAYDKFGNARTPIPDPFLQSFRAAQVPDIHYWTDDKLEAIFADPRLLITKDIVPMRTTADPDPKKVTIVNLVEMAKIWGKDNDWSAVTAAGYKQALDNMLKAVQRVSKVGQHSFAAELESHIEYVFSLPNFEHSYPYWYDWERESRNKILTRGMHFDLVDWKIGVSAALDRFRRDKAAGKLISLTKRAASPTPLGDARIPKAPRMSVTSAPFSRPGAPTDAFRPRLPPVCITCGGEHVNKNHPSTATSFPDGSPLFVENRDGTLYTAKSF